MGVVLRLDMLCLASSLQGDMSSAVRDSTSGAFQGLPRDMSLGRLIESGLR